MERLRASATLRNRKKEPTAGLHCLYKGLQVQIYIYILHANKRFTWGLNRSNRRRNSWNAPTHLARPSRTITFFLFIFFSQLLYVIIFFCYTFFTHHLHPHPRHTAHEDKALISGMTDFAHFNDLILLANFKLQKPTAQYITQKRFWPMFINKITECCLLFFPQTWTQKHDFPVWYNGGLSVAVKRDLPNK